MAAAAVMSHHWGMTPAVLLVDDDPEELDLIETALAPLGLAAAKADDGEQALRLIDERDFAVAVIDLVMPRLNGLEIAALIRGRKRGRRLPIIILTGYDEEGARMLPGWDSARGEVEYLSKPFLTETLCERVAAHADRFRALRAST